MRNFLINNVKWLLKYFKNYKWLFEILALFFILETFLYSIDLTNISDITNREVSALKIIFWILIFLISLLLYIKTDIEYTEKDDNITTSFFTGAVFSKYLIRLIIFILLSVNTHLLFRQLKISFNNRYFQFFWIGIGVLLFFEIVRVFIFLLQKYFKKENRKF